MTPTTRPRLAPLALVAGLALLVPAPAPAQDGVAGVLPGDRLRLRIWNEREMSDTFHVDERGDVVLPKLGGVPVRGLSPSAVRDTVHERYSTYLRNPAVEVTVLRRIGVHGEVKEPTVYWLDVTMSVRDAIALAGGVTEFGDADEIQVIRDGETIDLSSNGSAALLETGLRSGDQIVVGRKSWFVLNAPYVISSGISLLSLVTTIILSR